MRTVLISMASVLAVGLAAAALSACAGGRPPAPGSEADTGRQCFWASSVRNFTTDDGGQLLVRDRSDQVFELSAIERCLALDHASAVAIRPAFSDLGQLCVDDRATLSVRGLGGEPVTCRARVVRRLTPEETAALPAGKRP